MNNSKRMANHYVFSAALVHYGVEIIMMAHMGKEQDSITPAVMSSFSLRSIIHGRNSSGRTTVAGNTHEGAGMSQECVPPYTGHDLQNTDDFRFWVRTDCEVCGFTLSQLWDHPSQ